MLTKEGVFGQDLQREVRSRCAEGGCQRVQKYESENQVCAHEIRWQGSFGCLEAAVHNSTGKVTC